MIARTKLFLPLITLAIFAGLPPLWAQLGFSLAPAVQNGNAGDYVTFSAALTNNSTSNLFLNGIQFTGFTSTNLSPDTNAFFANVPGVLLPGEVYTGPVFRVLSTAATAPGDYFGSVSLHGGPTITNFDNLSTNTFQLTANPQTAPQITLQPVDTIAARGGRAYFVAQAANGSGVLNYQWQFNGTNIAGATLYDYTLTPVQLTNAGGYRLIVTNSISAVTSVVANLAVYSPVSITVQPVSQTLPQGLTAILSATINGDPPLGYQWQFNGAPIPGATLSSYTITNVQTTEAGGYSITVTNPASSTNSAIAFLGVIAPLANNPGAILAPPGIIDWWPADGNTLDIFGTNNGTPNYAFSYAPGKSGLAFEFDGISGYVSTGASNVPPPWSASMWVNRQNAEGSTAVLLADANYALKLEQYNGTRKVGFTHFTVADYTYNYIAPANVWTHLVFVGTTSNTALYANGILQSNIATSIPLPRAYLGASSTGGTTFINFMAGGLDEVILFNRALSSNEVAAIYSAGSSGLVRAPQFTAAAETNGQFGMSLQGQTDKSFTLYASTNLTNWQVLTNLANPTGAVNFTDSTATNYPRLFYRATQP